MTTEEQILSYVSSMYSIVALVGYVVPFFLGLWLYYRFRARSRWIR